jgi:hypothetical protein
MKSDMPCCETEPSDLPDRMWRQCFLRLGSAPASRAQFGALAELLLVTVVIGEAPMTARGLRAGRAQRALPGKSDGFFDAFC